MVIFANWGRFYTALLLFQPSTRPGRPTRQGRPTRPGRLTRPGRPTRPGRLASRPYGFLSNGYSPL